MPPRAAPETFSASAYDEVTVCQSCWLWRSPHFAFASLFDERLRDETPGASSRFLWIGVFEALNCPYFAAPSGRASITTRAWASGCSSVIVRWMTAS